MAETSAIRAGRAYVEISAKDKLLVRALSAVQAKMKAMGSALVDIGKKVAALGTAAIAPFIASLKVFADAGDAMSKMSQRTGIAVEALSELTYAASQSGASAESLEKGVRTMQRTLKGAAEGSDSAIQTLGQLGLTMKDLEGLTPDAQFKLIADRISKIEDPAVRAANAMEIFGKGGAELLPLMLEGSSGISELQKRARELGLTMSTEAANAAVEFGDNLDDVKKQLGKVVFEIGGALAPALTSLAKKFQRVMRDVIDWAKENREAIVVAAKVAAGIVAVGVALIAAGASFQALAFAMGPVILIAKGVGAAFAAIGPILTALLSPIGLVVAGFTGLFGLILTKTRTGQQALGAFGDAFETLKGDAQLAFGGIRDALASGDIAAAAKILWLALKLEWERGTHGLNLIWQSVKEVCISTWHDAVDGIAKLTVGLISGLKAAWVQFSSFFESLWVNIGDTVTNIWDEVQGWVENRIHDINGLLFENVDADALKDINNRNRDADSAKREKDRLDRLAEIERERVADLGKIGQNFEDVVGAIDDTHDPGRAQREKDAAASLEASAAELEAAKDALRAAVSDAGKRKEELLGGSLAARAKFLKDLGSEGADEGIPGLLNSFKTRGTFNKFSLQSLQGSGQNFAQQMVQEQRLAKDHLARAIQLLGDIKLRLPAFQ